SALAPEVFTRNSAMLSTEGNKSRFGPPDRTSVVETPSIENDVEFGRPPDTETFPAWSVCTPGARTATVSGLVLFVALKFSASEFISRPERELDCVGTSATTSWASTTWISDTVPANCSRKSERTVSRAGSKTFWFLCALNGGIDTVMVYVPGSRFKKRKLPAASVTPCATAPVL